MALNQGQQTACNAIMQLIFESEQPGANLIGEGGTGKTFTTMELVQEAVDGGLRVLMTAPTNKALKQLEKESRRYKFPLDKVVFKTLHSALGLSLMPSEENKYAHRVRASILEHFDVVGVDEGSMVGKRLLHEYLLSEQRQHHFFILGIGDDMQLPPVKETKSEMFELFPCFELTQNERQRVNPDGTPNGIQQITTPLRAAIKAGKTWDLKHLPENNVTLVKAADFLATILENFDKDTDLEQIRVLAWRNRRVDDINAMIRRKVYGPKAARFEVGERVVTGAPIGNGEETVLSTDEECIVRAVSESYITDEETMEEYKTWCLVLEPVYAEVDQVFAHVLHEDDQRRYEARLKALVAKAEKAQPSSKGIYWRKWHEFKELFSSIKYCYCITVHRAQGSTYKHGFVDVKDIMENDKRFERQRLMYVAFSRFQEELAINKIGIKV